MARMQEKSAIERAVDVAGSAAQLADQLGVSPQVLSNWKTRGRVPAEYCPNIEALTGIRCEELRPDISWGVLREQSRAKV